MIVANCYFLKFDKLSILLHDGSFVANLKGKGLLARAATLFFCVFSSVRY